MILEDNLEEMTLVANNGDMQTQYELGEYYRFRRDGTVFENHQQAFEWFKMAALQGHLVSQYRIAHMYDFSFSIPTDKQQALKWYLEVEKQGYRDDNLIPSYIASIYANNDELKDLNKALYWYQEHTTRQMEDPFAKVALADFLLENQDYFSDAKIQAIAWLKIAADQGHEIAQTKLGKLSLSGDGVTKNYQQAIVWFMKAADQGCPQAQYFLGVIYEHGYGVDVDLKKAKKWYQYAIEQEYPEAVKRFGANILENISFD